MVNVKKFSADVNGASAAMLLIVVCLICVPLLISMTGLSAVGVAVVPTARKT